MASRSSFRSVSVLLDSHLNSSILLSKCSLRRHCITITNVSSGNLIAESYFSNSTKQKSVSLDGHRPLSSAQQEYLDRALRVNQAGELAAVLIYDAQTPKIVRAHPHLKDLMKHMYDQEAAHFATFNNLIAKHRIRPTIMYPVWRLAASALGWSTAIMGREAAMACTEAVETEIGEHYNRQVQTLLKWADETENSGGEVSAEMKELLVTLRRIRDEELEHLDHAVEQDAKQAKPYELLTGVIRTGCRAAIWVTERV